MPDILLFGATGFTGRLTTAALARRNADFAIAGRDPAKLDTLASRFGRIETRVATAGDVDALVRALDDVKVLITCVGPFVEFGATAVEAALRAGVHYIDSTGEGPFIDQLVARDAEARGAGIAMAPALGFDEVPADVIATLATEGMDRPSLHLTYALPSSGSRGTIRSSLGIIVSDGVGITNGVRHAMRAGEEGRWAPMPPPLGPKASLTFPLGEGRLAPLHLELDHLRTAVTVSPARRLALAAGLPILRAATGSGPLRPLADLLLDRLPEGPDESGRRSRFMLLAEASDRAGRWRNVAIRGSDVYGLTAELLATGALEMARDGYDVKGVVAPTQAVPVETWQKVLAENDATIDVYEATTRGA